MIRNILENTKELLKKHWKILSLFLVMLFLLGGSFVLKNFSTEKDTSTSVGMTDEEVKNEENIEIKFTHQIFDPEKVRNIVPLGELNGGYNESQTINGVMIQMKGDYGQAVEPMEVYAPADMTLLYYSFIKDPRDGIFNYQLTFTVSKDLEITFHHITEVNDELKIIAAPTENSGGVPPSKKYSIRAGQLLAKTSGTGGHNWNIYLSDKAHTNQFVNQERYESLRGRYSFVNAICPFEPYENSVKETYLVLMGATAAGQSKTCGNPSKDVKGSISGLWHFSKETDNSTFMGKYDGKFATPFSIYKDSAGRIVIYEINHQRYMLGNENPTYQEPTAVVGEHCYSLSQYPGERRQGYAYFKVVSDMEMKLGYSSTGSCPASFPEGNSITYYR